jgi:hypothetical protein
MSKVSPLILPLSLQTEMNGHGAFPILDGLGEQVGSVQLAEAIYAGYGTEEDAASRTAKGQPTAVARGDFIVTAVNNHDALVAALEAMLKHSCVAEAHPEDKLPEDHEAESLALGVLLKVRESKP